MKTIAIHNRKILVVGDVAFYQSTGTSPSENITNANASERGDTYFPFFGLDHQGHLIKPNEVISYIGFREAECYEKFRSGYDQELLCDEILYAYSLRDLISDDMASRFRFDEAMIISAMIGGGFWETDDGKSVITELKKTYPNLRNLNFLDETTCEERIVFSNDDSEEEIRNKISSFNQLLKNYGVVLSKKSSEEQFKKLDEFKKTIKRAEEDLQALEKKHPDKSPHYFSQVQQLHRQFQRAQGQTNTVDGEINTKSIRDSLQIKAEQSLRDLEIKYFGPSELFKLIKHPKQMILSSKPLRILIQEYQSQDGADDLVAVLPWINAWQSITQICNSLQAAASIHEKELIQSVDSLKMELEQSLYTYIKKQVNKKQPLNLSNQYEWERLIHLDEMLISVREIRKNQPDRGHGQYQIQDTAANENGNNKTSHALNIIRDFEDKSKKSTAGWKKFAKPIAKVIVTAACCVLSASIGAVAGAALGGAAASMTGPGAIVSATVGALIGGSKGAIAGLAIGSTIGLGMSGYRMFKKSSIEKNCKNVAEKARRVVDNDTAPSPTRSPASGLQS